MELLQNESVYMSKVTI